MQLLQLTLDTLAENVALDEALLEAAEAGQFESGVSKDGAIDGGILRLWEPTDYGVVLGRSSVATTEVQLGPCQADRVPVLRRASGGGTVVTGPGCLMYAVVLDLETHPQLAAIDAAHCYVLSRLAKILTPLLPGQVTGRGPNIEVAGTSDLILTGTPPRKFSGNAMRRKRSHLLYHGTLLYDFDLSRLPCWLAAPTREPEYRAARAHAEFVVNLPLARQALVNALVEGWQAHRPLAAWPKQRVEKLVNTKYNDDPQWVVNFQC